VYSRNEIQWIGSTVPRSLF